MIDAANNLKNSFPGSTISEFRNQTRVVVPTAALFEALEFLLNDEGFNALVDITCVDYLTYRNATDRFALVYLLTNLETNERLTIKAFLNEPDLMVRSVVSLWSGANWMEREVWDMFGITFDGHPDHRRILLPEAFVAHPLRKDYPLQGRGERHNFHTITRGEA